MLKTTSRVICTAAALAAVVAVPATAEAKKPAGPQTAHFEATLTGSQVTTWEYHQPDNEDDPCDASADGYGDQTIKFDAGGDFNLDFTKPSKKQPNLFLTQGRPVVTPARIAVAAKADRNGEFTVHTEDIDQNRCDGQNGGGVNPDGPPPKDCGMRQGIFRTDFFYYFGRGDENLFVPTPGGIPADANRLKLSGDGYDWRGLNGEHESQLDRLYTNCPFVLEDARLEESGFIFTSAAKLNEKKLFDKRRRKITVSGSTIAGRGGRYSTGQTIIAWNLRLTRVK
jgi:hypothetical protein